MALEIFIDESGYTGERRLAHKKLMPYTNVYATVVAAIIRTEEVQHATNSQNLHEQSQSSRSLA